MVYLTGKKTVTSLSAFFVSVGWLMISASSISAKTIYVSPSGTSAGDGSSFARGYDIATGISKAAAGDIVLLQGDKYTIPYNASAKNTLAISATGQSGKNITIMGENNKMATIDFSYPDNSKVLNNSITSVGLEVTGSYLYFKNISVTRAGYQGAYVSGKYITFENCAFYKNWNSGIEINKGGSYVTLTNCDAYGNYDGKYKNGGMGDGFAIKQTMGPGNKVIGCRSWDNSDDGYDTYDSPEFVVFENCWAIRNGFDQGNGNGFKVGGLSKVQKNILKNCVSLGNVVKGFDQNSNTGGITVYNCISYQNGTNFGFGGTVTDGKNIFKNCVSLSNKGTDAFGSATQSNNSWNSGFAASSSDFESLDTSLATVKRNPDGSLPETKLFQLKPISKLINAGVDVGMPFVGTNPDLGAFEFAATNSVTTNKPNSILNFKQTISNKVLIVSFNSNVKKANVSLYSLNGTTLLKTNMISGREVHVNCSLLPSGSYIAEVSIDGVKQHIHFTL